MYLMLLFIVYKLKIIPYWITICLFILAFSPFWFNGMLFPPEYMPDQFKYLKTIESLRNLNFQQNVSNSVYSASFALSLFPLPFIYNVIGLAFINKFIILILFLYLYSKKYLHGIALYTMLFYPDLIIYTSLALRDTLVVLFMVLGTIFLLKKQNYISILVYSPLLIIKAQNFILMLILWLLYILLMKNEPINSKKTIITLLLVFLLSLITLLLVAPYFLETFNYYRAAMFRENDGDLDNYIPIHNIKDFLILGFKNSFYFLLKPFIFEADNKFQIMQAFLNMTIFVFLIAYTLKSYFKNKFKTLFWFSFLMFSMSIYGLVVSNYGTAARYRFPFIIVYILALHIETKQINKRCSSSLKKSD